jgi:hypothetical protein
MAPIYDRSFSILRLSVLHSTDHPKGCSRTPKLDKLSALNPAPYTTNPKHPPLLPQLDAAEKKGVHLAAETEIQRLELTRLTPYEARAIASEARGSKSQERCEVLEGLKTDMETQLMQLKLLADQQGRQLDTLATQNAELGADVARLEPFGRVSAAAGRWHVHPWLIPDAVATVWLHLASSVWYYSWREYRGGEWGFHHRTCNGPCR